MLALLLRNLPMHVQSCNHQVTHLQSYLVRKAASLSTRDVVLLGHPLFIGQPTGLFLSNASNLGLSSNGCGFCLSMFITVCSTDLQDIGIPLQPHISSISLEGFFSAVEPTHEL